MKNTTKTKAEVSPLFRNQKGIEYKTGILTVSDGVSEMHFAFYAPYDYREEAYKVITSYLDGWDSCYEAMVSKLMQCFDLATADDLEDNFVGVDYNVKTDKIKITHKNCEGDVTDEISGLRRDIIADLSDYNLNVFGRIMIDGIKEDLITKERTFYKEVANIIRALHNQEPFIRL